MAIRSSIYKALRDKIKDSISELAYIDLQKGQFENKSQNYPIPLPACLIEFKQIEWSDTTGEQIGDAVISLHYYADIVTDSFDTAEREDETINILDNLDLLYKNVQGFHGDGFNPLDRINDDTEDYGLRYIHFRTDFKTAVFEADPQPLTTSRPSVSFQ